MVSTTARRSLAARLGRFVITFPMPFITILIGIICGLLWQQYRQAAIIIFLLLTAYAVIGALIGIVKDIRDGHVGVDILAIVAILATTAVNQYWASWIVILMIYSGDTIEDFAESKAGQNLTALMNSAPQIAHVMHGTSEQSSWDTVGVDAVKVGDRILVKPGETVPVNGLLISQQATVDLSMINGEPVPVDVYQGGKLLSGAINGSDSLIFEATATAAASQYQKILQLVKAAQESRATVVKTADMLAVPFTVISLAIAFIGWYASGDPLRFAQVLVLATPCPLLIAAPVAYLGGTGRLAKIGIIIKTQEVLENLGSVSHIFFDKTGTLTRKRPNVARIDLLPAAVGSYDEDTVLRLAGPLEAYSVHILAKGISSAAAALTRRKQLPPLSVSGAREESGSGTMGTVDGHQVRVGRAAFVDPTAGDPASLFPPLSANEMVAYVSVDGSLVARIVLADFARDNAAAAIRKLKALGISRLSMLTGDNEVSAKVIGDQVGISDIYSRLLPEGKVQALRDAKNDPVRRDGLIRRTLRRLVGAPERTPVTMMVGDGVNDAPVLAAASIGVAMTDGSSTAASESAHVVIMNDDIEMVPAAIEISRQTRRTMLQAVLAGLGIAIVLMICASFNLIPVVVGALLQEIIDVFSILWALTAILDHKSRKVAQAGAGVGGAGVNTDTSDAGTGAGGADGAGASASGASGGVAAGAADAARAVSSAGADVTTGTTGADASLTTVATSSAATTA